jgi:two-component system response regulator DevR
MHDRVRVAPIRILIVEDHQVVAEGLSFLLNDQQDMSVVGVAESLDDTLTLVLQAEPDVVLLDFHLKNGTGDDVGQAILRVRPRTRLIFLTRESGDGARFAAENIGASGFIHKSRAAAEVVDAVRVVGNGGTLVGPNAMSETRRQMRSRPDQREQLTAREKEVLRLMAMGVPSREIASRLEISYTTVRTHIRSLGSKLDVHSKLEAIVRARELSLIE